LPVKALDAAGAGSKYEGMVKKGLIPVRVPPLGLPAPRTSVRCNNFLPPLTYSLYRKIIFKLGGLTDVKQAALVLD
jgi:hypothetical protein